MTVHFYLKKKRTKDCTVKVVSSLDTLSFCQAVNEPTHEHGHTLDWVRFRLEDNVLCSSTVTRAIASDHFCVVCELCVAVPPDPAVYRESRDIRAIDRAAFCDDLCTLVSPELRPSIGDFNSTLQSLLEKHAPLCRRRVRADRLEPRYRNVRNEPEAAKKHKRWAERQWVKTATTANEQILNAVNRLVAKIVHKAKSLFFGKEIAMSTSSRKLLNVCDRLIDRKRSSPLLSTQSLPSSSSIL